MVKKLSSTEFLLCLSGIFLAYWLRTSFGFSWEVPITIVALASGFFFSRAMHKKNFGSRGYTAFITREFCVLLVAFYYIWRLLDIGFSSRHEVLLAYFALIFFWTISRGLAKSDSRLRVQGF